ncbi:Odorant receptor Or2 [Melipona quadrifasciata]|uniref:Odorant receptor n=1 Tax=Melipona quadrifasciata TaxID=166423 RepID=A0A0N1ISZ4_9HYME|nr:Odorant receptor Or2 [Melipona quadrifasciata]
MTMQLCDAIRDKNFDNIIQNLPQIMTIIISMIKIINIYYNKTKFRELFNSMAEDWKFLESRNELHILNEFTKNGSTLALFYRNVMIFITYLYDHCSMYNNFSIKNNSFRNFTISLWTIYDQEHFYILYVHLALSSCVIVLIIITVDSLYITIIYHACGLFAVCGSQVQNTAENNTIEKNGTDISSIGYEQFKQCIIMHYKTLQFYDVIEKCCRNMYLMQIGLNMAIVSVTAVEVIVFLDRPGEAIKATMYLIAQNFHLYLINLPGQTLLDQSLELADKIYDSDWYQIPTKVQKMLHLMQIRSNKPCILTAAGLYDMKIENYGATIKACMSYFTMFLSLRE